MNYTIVSTIEGQHNLRSALGELLEACYGRDIEDKWWKFLYLSCPYGCAISVCAWDEGGLVGHYAVTPMVAVDADGHRLKIARGMSLVVAPRARREGVLKKLFQRLQEPLEKAGIRVVIGFPNAVSYMPLRVMCGWHMVYESPFEFVDQQNRTVNHLTQIMRWNICCHTNCNTG